MRLLQNNSIFGGSFYIFNPSTSKCSKIEHKLAPLCSVSKWRGDHLDCSTVVGPTGNGFLPCEQIPFEKNGGIRYFFPQRVKNGHVINHDGKYHRFSGVQTDTCRLVDFVWLQKCSCLTRGGCPVVLFFLGLFLYLIIY